MDMLQAIQINFTGTFQKPIIFSIALDCLPRSVEMIIEVDVVQGIVLRVFNRVYNIIFIIWYLFHSAFKRVSCLLEVVLSCLGCFCAPGHA